MTVLVKDVRKAEVTSYQTRISAAIDDLKEMTLETQDLRKLKTIEFNINKMRTGGNKQSEDAARKNRERSRMVYEKNREELNEKRRMKRKEIRDRVRQGGYSV